MLPVGFDLTALLADAQEIGALGVIVGLGIVAAFWAVGRLIGTIKGLF